MKSIAVVLAGGMSRRMGQDKAALEFGGLSLLERTVKKYAPLFDEIYVSLNRSGRFPTYGARELLDDRPGAGPMAGLESAFLHTDADFVFLTATDLPFSDPALVPALLSGCRGHDVCLLSTDEPLFAVYARSCLPRIQALLDGDMRKLRALLDGLDVNALGLSEADALLNVNDPAELRRALERLDPEKR